MPSKKHSKKAPHTKNVRKNAKRSRTETSTDANIVFSSVTRNQTIQFDRDPASFFGWTSCAYRAGQLNYRRPDGPKGCRMAAAGSDGRSSSAENEYRRNAS